MRSEEKYTIRQFNQQNKKYDSCNKPFDMKDFDFAVYTNHAVSNKLLKKGVQKLPTNDTANQLIE